MSEKKLIQKILEITKEVGPIGKDLHVQFGSTDYKARSEEAVLNTLKPLFQKHRIVMLPVSGSQSLVGKVTVLDSTWEIRDVDSDEVLTVYAPGTGHDSSDKGAGKAFTYAFKNLLLKLFMIVSNEDPDKTSSEETVSKEIEDARKKLLKCIDDVALDNKWPEKKKTEAKDKALALRTVQEITIGIKKMGCE